MSELKRLERIRRKMTEVSKKRKVLVKLRLNDKRAYCIYCALAMR